MRVGLLVMAMACFTSVAAGAYAQTSANHAESTLIVKNNNDSNCFETWPSELKVKDRAQS